MQMFTNISILFNESTTNGLVRLLHFLDSNVFLHLAAVLHDRYLFSGAGAKGELPLLFRSYLLPHGGAEIPQVLEPEHDGCLFAASRAEGRIRAAVCLSPRRDSTSISPFPLPAPHTPL